MRFITEFKLNEYTKDDIGYLSNKKYASGMELGKLVADTFGWQNPVLENELRYRVEIEAFPMDKWVEFKKRLFAHLGTTGLYDKTFKNLVSELESFRNTVT